MKKFIVDNNVQIKSKITTNKMMVHFFIALLPILCFMIYKNGLEPYMAGEISLVLLFRPLWLMAIAAGLSYLLEMGYAKIILKHEKEDLKKYLKNSYAIFPGLLLVLLLPNNISILALSIGVLMAVIFGKMVFGGFGKNIFNPALVGFAFLLIVFPSAFAGTDYQFLVGDKIITPLSNFANLQFVGSYNEVVAPYGGLSGMFFGTNEAVQFSALLCLLSLLYLTVFRVVKTKIPVTMIATVFVMTMVIGYYNNMGIWYPVFNVISGSFLLAAIFLATDSVTSPATNIGQIIYGLLLGILVVVFRYFTPLVDGALIAILILNGVIFLIDKIGVRYRFDYYKAAIIILLPIILGVVVTLLIASNLEAAEVTNIDKNFKIIAKNCDDKFIYYQVLENGAEAIEAKVTLNPQGVITKIVVLKTETEFYQILTSNDYISKIIANQNDLSKVPDIETEGKMSDLMKQMITNVLKDYKTNGV